MWSEGYVTDIDYTSWFFPELSPTNLSLAMLLEGYDWTVDPQNFSYLELGFGQGVSLAINSAVTPGSYCGTDFLASHARNAAELQAASGSKTSIHSLSFEEFARIADLPSFDVIILHGIWSWVSEENRNIIREIIRKHLKPGGICYVSYNCFPGWTEFLPLQKLFSSYAQSLGVGSLESQIHDANHIVEQMLERKARAFYEKSPILEKIRELKKSDSKYIAHEFFNIETFPFLFSEVARQLASSGLSFAASARLVDQIDALNISREAREFIGSIDDVNFSHDIKDFFMNRSFRRDIFAKGVRRMSAAEQDTRWLDLPFVIVGDTNDRPSGMDVRNGRLSFDPKLYGPLMDAFADQDFKPRSLRELQDHRSLEGFSAAKLSEAVRLLCCRGFLAPVQSPDVVTRAVPASQALNKELCRRAEFSSEVLTLAAPLIGTGVSVSRVEQLFLHAEQVGVEDVPTFVWKILKSQGESLVKAGKPIEGDEGNLSQLQKTYVDFFESRRPFLVRLGAVSEKPV